MARCTYVRTVARAYTRCLIILLSIKLYHLLRRYWWFLAICCADAVWFGVPGTRYVNALGNYRTVLCKSIAR
ncbi:hypothetical protein F5884DRAFT_786413 [Xylogone sp. PMI_703]|nr:hypothetical protein F5884DRAFT_786413 [Xylogone sp. PMI_703]